MRKFEEGTPIKGLIQSTATYQVEPGEFIRDHGNGFRELVREAKFEAEQQSKFQPGDEVFQPFDGKPGEYRFRTVKECEYSKPGCFCAVGDCNYDESEWEKVASAKFRRDDVVIDALGAVRIVTDPAPGRNGVFMAGGTEHSYAVVGGTFYTEHSYTKIGCFDLDQS